MIRRELREGDLVLVPWEESEREGVVVKLVRMARGSGVEVRLSDRAVRLRVDAVHRIPSWVLFGRWVRRHRPSRAIEIAGAISGVVVAVLTILGLLGAFSGGGSTPAREGRLARGTMRLAIVKKVNELRHERSLPPLSYDPALSIAAQQQAHYGVAYHAGLTASPQTIEAPSGQTNMWAEMAGVACSWQHLFRVSRLGKKLPPKKSGPAEIGFASFGADVGQNLPEPVLSPHFKAIGVGVELVPDNGGIAVAIDLVGPPRADAPAMPVTTPNIVTQVLGVPRRRC